MRTRNKNDDGEDGEVILGLFACDLLVRNARGVRWVNIYVHGGSRAMARWIKGIRAQHNGNEQRGNQNHISLNFIISSTIPISCDEFSCTVRRSSLLSLFKENGIRLKEKMRKGNSSAKHNVSPRHSLIAQTTHKSLRKPNKVGIEMFRCRSLLLCASVCAFAFCSNLIVSFFCCCLLDPFRFSAALKSEIQFICSFGEGGRCSMARQLLLPLARRTDASGRIQGWAN